MANDDLPFDATRFSSYRSEISRVGDLISDNVEGLDEAVAIAYQTTGAWIGVVINAPNGSDGVTFAYSQLTNEFWDLLYDCVCGRGRSALKACRSLFELLLTVKAIVPDPVARSRYEDHRWVIFNLSAELEMKKPERQKSDRHRRKKALAYAQRRLDPVLARHGNRFPFSWRTESLADTARYHGLAEEYDFYRLASGVLHGSSGGVLGQYALDGVENEEMPVHRTGQALSLCPDSFRRGVAYFRLAVIESEAVVGPGATNDLILACDDLLRLANTYEDFLDHYDQYLWATVQRRNIIPVACVDFRGEVKWLLHDTVRNEVRIAEPPVDVTVEQNEALERTRQMRRKGQPIPGTSGSDVVTIAIMGARLIPKQGSTWQPAARYLQQAPLSVDGPRGFGTIERSPDWLPSDHTETSS